LFISHITPAISRHIADIDDTLAYVTLRRRVAEPPPPASAAGQSATLRHLTLMRHTLFMPLLPS